MTSDEIIAQAFGFLSLSLGISTFYQRDDRRLKIVMLIFNLNHLLHYFLLGSIVSAFSALLSVFRTALSIKTSSKVIAFIFITITLVTGISLADHLWQLWPVLGSAIGTYTLFVLKGIKMRIGFLLGACCWLTNNILVGSIGGTLLEMTAITMNLITIYRLSKGDSSVVKI
ncbi:YgjV family protein [Psychromonas sp. KJ10-10]|uniref:YgjV family protein n=1 Tax=Psychromonas sp. KJ10-10 TaxID=3391823 RepID=UPI0039B5B937